MGSRRELAEAAVGAYGQPHFSQAMQELFGVVENPNKAWHHLGEAGMKQAMLGHARELRRMGQPSLAKNVLREVGIRFGNSTKID